MELKLLEKAGKINTLSLQPRFKIKVQDQLICTYVGDFYYWKRDGELYGKWVLEDVKGVKTDVYRIKKKLMKACFGIEIKEI